MGLRKGTYELLAPAADTASGIIAIDSGADAVYIGAPRFGARQAAGNSLEAIAELTKYAHRYWAKVYVALNTLLRDDEIDDAVRIARAVYEHGVDGLIIQDVGLLECDLPPLPLIASTQMHNVSAKQVRFLEEVGFQRAILARELSLREISDIASQTRTIELECFVHGAICVSYSGRCYLSYARGGRSGNRGQCAQPCRKRYRLLDSLGRDLSSKYWLSLKDMNRADYLGQLIDSGITSFKIEGRLRDAAYVANVVSYYRQRLDLVLEEKNLSSSPVERVIFSFRPDLQKTFHRGYTAFFLDHEDSDVSARETPKMVGEPIGALTECRENRIGLRERVDLHAGDGICFFDDSGRLKGTRIDKIDGDLAVVRNPGGLRVGIQLFRNHDKAWLDHVKRGGNKRRVLVDFELSQGKEQLLLMGKDRVGNRATATRSGSFPPARKSEQAASNIERNLRKTGNTMFEVGRIHILFEPILFLPTAMVNEMRREVLEKLVLVREDARPRPGRGLTPNDTPYPEGELSYEGNVLNEKARQFYRRHGVKKIESAAESGRDLTGQRVMTSRYCIARQSERCPRWQGRGGGSAEDLILVSPEGERLKLVFDCGLCEMTVVLI